MKICFLEYDTMSNATVENVINNSHEICLYPMETESIYDEVTVIFAKLKYFLNEKFLKRFGKLRWILTPTTGLNHIDVEYCRENNINIISLKNEVEFLNEIPATAEFAWLCILNLLRKFNHAIEDTKNGNWRRNKFRGFEVKDKIIGIVGYGRIGKMVARYAEAFGSEIIIADLDDVEVPVKKRRTLEQIFQQADIVTLHIDYCAKNKNLIDEKLFTQTKKGIYFVNTARGELICENSLITALDNKYVLAAHLDVLQSENLDNTAVNNSMLSRYAEKNTNLIITPHIGGATHESTEKTELFVFKKYLDSLDENDEDI